LGAIIYIGAESSGTGGRTQLDVGGFCRQDKRTNNGEIFDKLRRSSSKEHRPRSALHLLGRLLERFPSFSFPATEGFHPTKEEEKKTPEKLLGQGNHLSKKDAFDSEFSGAKRVTRKGGPETDGTKRRCRSAPGVTRVSGFLESREETQIQKCLV